jgi:hypothetical protein
MAKNDSKKSDKYRKPPVAYQFKKGASGNPAGRPPRKKPSGSSALGGGIEDRVSAMALEEAMRPITVREGGEVFEIPAFQALLRVMFRDAGGGDNKVQRLLVELTMQAESGRANAALKLLEDAAYLKEKHIALFEKHKREGREPPDIYPDPDDIVFDVVTGEVTIDGPMSKEQAGAQKAFRELALQSLPRYFEVAAALKSDPSNRELRRELKDLQKYMNFLQADAARNFRREALRLSREALKQKPTEPKTAEPKVLEPKPEQKQLEPKPTEPKNDNPERP